MSNLKVFVLLAGMVALFGVVGGMLGGQSGMLLALALSAVMSFMMYFNSGKMAPLEQVKPQQSVRNA